MTTTVAAPGSAETANRALCLDIEGLSIGYGAGPEAVSDVSLKVAQGEIVGVIGESGCGKSSIGLALLGLLPQSAQVSARRMDVAGHDYIGMTEKGLRGIRGDDVSMIFQEPMSALNPVMRIGAQIQEVLVIHGATDRAALQARALELLKLVQVPEPELRLKQFPHQMSGGMRQRIMIAIAMAANPKLLVADEPTTALDVTVQAQILALLRELRDTTGMGMVLISHDLGVISDTCDRVVVMYAGQVIEEGDPEQVLTSPAHPYTAALLNSVPRLTHPPRTELPAISGGILAEDRARPGCRFAPRCTLAEDACHEPQALRRPAGAGSPAHLARCLKSTLPLPVIRSREDASL